MSTIFRLAVQKSGRLYDRSFALLKNCDIELPSMRESLRVKALNMPLEILLLRDDDIPEYIKDKVVDAGIVGINVLAEQRLEFPIFERLGFGRCRLSIAAPKGSSVNQPADLNGTRIATSHPNILKAFLAAKKIKAEIYELSGSVEMAPSIGLADVVCDLVSTGSTLFSNGLEERFSIFESEAVFVATEPTSAGAKNLIDQLLLRVRSVRRAANTKYILLNTPNEAIGAISKILPGVKSPTIVPLAEEGWSSIHSVVEVDMFWEVIEQLKSAGAQGILVMPIEKIID
jgi:ATP phosphoribosyltransferase